MSSKTLPSAPEVHTTLRAGVRQRTGVSKTAKGAMFLFARAGVVVSVVFVRALRGRFKRRGVPLREHVWRQYEELWSSSHNQLVFVKGSASRLVQRANPPE